jgi:hypothetical protein
VSFTAPNVKGWYMVGINRGTEDETWAQVHDFTRLEHSIYVRGDGDQFGMATFGIFETGVQVTIACKGGNEIYDVKVSTVFALGPLTCLLVSLLLVCWFACLFACLLVCAGALCPAVVQGW